MPRESADKREGAPVPRPTPAELEILKVLWRRGPSTVRQVHDAFAQSRPVAYTTVLKTMQIMRGKGLLERTGDAQRHLYSPAVPEERTRAELLDDLVDRVFGGSAAELILGALARRPTSASEIDEIRRILDRNRKESP